MTLHWKNTTNAWGWISIALHWVTALLVISLMISGWVAEAMSFSPTKIEWFVWHKSLGLLVLLLTGIRLIWLMFARRPAWLGTWHWQGTTVHVALYSILLAMPLSGWIINSAGNFPFRWFHGPRVPALVAPDKVLKALAEDVHLTLFWVFALMLCVHLIAATWHHFKGDSVLKRMLGISEEE